MGLGDILGSLSPAFGLASGKGMFGNLSLNGLGQSGMGGLLGLLLSHGGSSAQASAAPMLPGTSIPTPQIAPSLPGPGISQMAGSLPSPSASNPLGAIGSALQQGGAQGSSSAPVSSQAPGLVPPNHAGLQAILQALGIF